MGDRITMNGNFGTVGDVGSRHYHAPPSTAPDERPAPARGDSPAAALYAFADIIGYSKLNARLQKLSQDDLARILDAGVGAAGVTVHQVAKQDQGDARLLAFSASADVAQVLALMPRAVNHELAARNADMADHARMRLRLSFSMGVGVPGGTGLVGAAPVAVVRLADSAAIRQAMRLAPQAQCGVIIDDYLYSQWVRQGFRSDIDPADYTPVQVSYPDKGFEATGWLMLFGYAGAQVASLVGSPAPSAPC